MGINIEGKKEILDTWISENESASFYASICSDLKNRGVKDIFIADLKKVYSAVNLDKAEFAKEEFREKWDTKYPNILKSWDKKWAELTVFFENPLEIRKIIYTTNTVESYHRMVRKSTKSKSIFPTDDSIRKVIYMSVSEVSKKWTMLMRDWGLVYAHFSIYLKLMLIEG